MSSLFRGLATFLLALSAIFFFSEFLIACVCCAEKVLREAYHLWEKAQNLNVRVAHEACQRATERIRAFVRSSIEAQQQDAM